MVQSFEGANEASYEEAAYSLLLAEKRIGKASPSSAKATSQASTTEATVLQNLYLLQLKR